MLLHFLLSVFLGCTSVGPGEGPDPDVYYVPCDSDGLCENESVCVSGTCTLPCRWSKECGFDMRCQEGCCEIDFRNEK